MTASIALLYTPDIDSSKARYIGAQVLFGFGVGFGNQIPIMAVQGLSKPEDVTASTGIMFSKFYPIWIYILYKYSVFANARTSDPIC